MASYCNIGDTARVTFPDGSIQLFRDTPISIEIEYLEECQNATLHFTYTKINPYTNEVEKKQGYAQIKLPVGNSLLIDEYKWKIFAYCRGNIYQCYPPYWHQIALFRGGGDVLTAEIDKVVPHANSSVKIIVKNTSGNILYQNIYDTSDYSVDCIESCPEGTLNCGDCCLPCGEVSNKISTARKLLKYKKMKQ